MWNLKLLVYINTLKAVLGKSINKYEGKGSTIKRTVFVLNQDSDD